MKQLYFFTLCILSLNLPAQTPQVCGYDLILEQLKQANPQYEQQRDAWYRKAFAEYNSQYSKRGGIVRDTVYYEIPVVFHVVYKNAQENLSDAQVISQLTALNRAFRRTNADTVNTRNIFKPVARDTRVQFVMASKDPLGNPTIGITRTPTTVQQFGNVANLNNDMKFTSKGGQDGWDPTRYLNIWICDLKDPTYGEVLYGFAYPPDGTPNWQNSTVAVTSPYSGVVLHYKIVGLNNPLATVNYQQGKTAVHEVGHYLGLRHIWGDGQFGNGCSVDDGIDDTPNAKASNATCDTTKNSCIDTARDKPDMVENYMDYTPNQCQNTYTHGQTVIIHYVLNNFRTALPYMKINTDTIKNPPPPAVFGINIFPNPVTSNIITIRVSDPVGETLEADIYDLIGNVVSTHTLKLNADNEIRVDNLAEGVFVVRIHNGDRSVDIRRRVLKISR